MIHLVKIMRKMLKICPKFYTFNETYLKQSYSIFNPYVNEPTFFSFVRIIFQRFPLGMQWAASQVSKGIYRDKTMAV